MLHLMSHHRGQRLRLAFTLMELLVVIVLVAVLISLTAGTVIRLMGTAQSSATQSNVTKVQKALSTQYATVMRKAQGEPLPPPNPAEASIYQNVVLPLANNDPRLARVLWVKLRLKQFFPVSFAEAINPLSPIANMPSLYSTVLSKQYGVTKGTTPPADYESAACLWLALQNNTGGGVASEELSKSAIASYPMPPLPAGMSAAIPVLVDAYPSDNFQQGTPLMFSRWPVYCDKLNPGGGPGSPPSPQLGFNDPEDKEGLLNNPAWLTWSAKNKPSFGGYVSWYQMFQTQWHPVPSSADRTTAGNKAISYKVQPLVVSAGPDTATLGFPGGLGLDTSIPTIPGASRPAAGYWLILGPAAYDNIYSK